MINENQHALKPVDYLKIIFRRKWLVIAPVFLGLVIGVVAGYLMPKVYESSTTILVEEEKVINPLIEGLAVSTSMADRLHTIQEQILSWKNLVKLSQKLGLVKDMTNHKAIEGLVGSLRRNILVGLRGINVITLAYQSAVPEETKKVVDSLTELFIQENIDHQTRETEIAITFIKEQLKVYRRKIKESEIADLQEQLDALLVDATERHPRVKDLRQQMAAAKKELESDEYEVDARSIRPISDPAQKRIAEELDKMKQEEVKKLGLVPEAQANTSESIGNLYKVLLMDKLDTVKARDAGVNENIYNKLLERLESAKITQRLEASKEGTRYTVLNPPHVPAHPIKPNKLLVALMGMFFGAIGGVGLVLGIEFMDNSILDIDEAKASLDLPVLGAISRIATEEELEQEKAKRRTTMTIVIAISVAIVLAVLLFVFFTSP